jgi:hypothetical protein
MPGVWGSADGTNSAALLFEPVGIVVDPTGAIYVMDSGSHAVRKVALFGTNWVVSTVAGLAGVAGSVNGTGAGTRFRHSAGLALDGAGYLYIADAGNNTIRVDRIVPPWLQYARAGNQASLFWPSSGNNFSLESSSSVSPGALWSPVTNTPIGSADIFVLNLPLADSAAFYRLHKP